MKPITKLCTMLLTIVVKQWRLYFLFYQTECVFYACILKIALILHVWPHYNKLEVSELIKMSHELIQLQIHGIVHIELVFKIKNKRLNLDWKLHMYMLKIGRHLKYRFNAFSTLNPVNVNTIPVWVNTESFNRFCRVIRWKT